MQPLASGTKGTLEAEVEFASDTVSCFSMSMESPNSLTMGVREVVG